MNAQTDLTKEAAAAISAPDGTASPAKPKRRIGRTALMLAVPVVLALGGGVYWVTSGRYETTENAALHQARITVASDLSGRVVRLAVHDNQPVKAGDLLFQVDPEPWQLALSDAQVAVESARLTVEQLKVAYDQAQAQARVAAENAAYAQDELNRQKELTAKGVASTTALEDAQHAANLASEQAEVANKAVANALAALGDPTQAVDSHPKVRAALVALDKAKYNLGLTEVHAPENGIVYQASSFREGQMVTAGSPLFTLVANRDAWVEANFKETQLTGIAVGQPAEIVFDVRPDERFSGTVEAIGAGTGAEFSLLPAQNATGNWVKVTQRVPVRIKLDDPAAAADLSSGMSATVDVDTGRGMSLSDLAGLVKS
ncbi:HlyD family secretion protein [Neotabrizicola shimadae]|uniref:HlyD family secretion protein n=1 Tax=Neotabrizicola shimadae TaxID=2807096 RepID=A0A8G1EDZ9_9RHOB|nr:HlyD family secretion protein [Neotabrizicola shimadae]QYZ69974.1 HlyD family secretion protein [Neotabrizicola shimadae]